MSAYLKYFQLEQSPFDTSPQSALVLGTQAVRDAFAQIEAGLLEEAPRICVTGASGLGKTSLARALPKLLSQQARVALLLNPALSWAALRGAIVRQLDLEGAMLSRKSLLAKRSEGRRLVLVIDAAEQLDRESLEHLDILLAYRTEDDTQLVHCVLLANLERAREQPDCPLLWWLDSLNTLQLEFTPIPAAGVRSYILKHLKRAGWSGGELFSAEAARSIHRHTGGVPRSVSALCERVLEAAAERGLDRIGADLVEELCGEPPSLGGTPLVEDAEEVVLERAVETLPRPAPARTNLEASAEQEPSAGTGRATSSSMISTGLDAFFGPASAAPAPKAPAVPVAAEIHDARDGFAEEFDPAGPVLELEHEVTTTRGGRRWLGLAAAIVLVAGLGLAVAAWLSSDDAGDDAAGEPIAAVAPDAAEPAGEPDAASAAERVRLAQDAAGAPKPDAARDGVADAIGVSVTPPATPAVAQTTATPAPLFDPAAPPPAAPALEWYERSDERHF